jgi:lysozyme
VRKPAAELQASDLCLNVIKHFESLKLQAYKCPAGILTIGWGHTAGVHSGMSITEAEALELLREDVADAEKAVRDRVKVPLSQGEFDGLVSFVFNIKRSKWDPRHCTLLRKLNEGDYTAPAGPMWGFAVWNKGKDPKTGELRGLPGLTRRRQAELALYLGIPQLV